MSIPMPAPLSPEKVLELRNIEYEYASLLKQQEELDRRFRDLAFRRRKLLGFEPGTRKSPRRTLTREEAHQLILGTLRK